MQVQFGRDPADAPLKVPDGFTAAARFAEDGDVVHIGLRVVAEDQAEQGSLARAIGAKQGPAFAGTDCPVDVLQDGATAVAHRYVPHFDEGAGEAGGWSLASRVLRLGPREKVGLSEGVWPLGCARNPCSRAGGNDPAIIHAEHVRHMAGQVLRPRGDEQHSHGRAHELFQDGMKVLAVGRIQPCERFIQYQQAQRARECARQLDTLPLAIG